MYLYADMVIGLSTSHLKTLIGSHVLWKFIDLLPFGYQWSYPLEGVLGCVSAISGLLTV